MAKEKSQLNERLRIVAKRVDHLERAFRKEERPLLAADYDRQKVADREAHDAANAAARDAAIAQQKAAIELKTRLGRMMPDYVVAREQVESQRKEEFERSRKAAEKKIQEEKQKFKDEVVRRRQQEREARERRRAEEEEAERAEEGEWVYATVLTKQRRLPPVPSKKPRRLPLSRRSSVATVRLRSVDWRRQRRPRRPVTVSVRRLPKPPASKWLVRRKPSEDAMNVAKEAVPLLRPADTDHQELVVQATGLREPALPLPPLPLLLAHPCRGVKSSQPSKQPRLLEAPLLLLQRSLQAEPGSPVVEVLAVQVVTALRLAPLLPAAGGRLAIHRPIAFLSRDVCACGDSASPPLKCSFAVSKRRPPRIVTSFHRSSQAA